MNVSIVTTSETIPMVKKRSRQPKHVEHRKIGKLSNLCTRRGSSYYCDHTDLTDEQLKSMGMRRHGAMRPEPVSTLKDEMSCIKSLIGIIGRTPRGRIAIFHGTSSEAASGIIKNGFKLSTGILGKGAYFVIKFDEATMNINYNSAIARALTSKEGDVIFGQIDASEVYTYGRIFDEKGEKKAAEFQKMTTVPASLEVFFNSEGQYYDDPDSLRRAYDELGTKAMEYALKQGINAFSDGYQIVIYNREILSRIRFTKIKTCKSVVV